MNPHPLNRLISRAFLWALLLLSSLGFLITLAVAAFMDSYSYSTSYVLPLSDGSQTFEELSQTDITFPGIEEPFPTSRTITVRATAQENPGHWMGLASDYLNVAAVGLLLILVICICIFMLKNRPFGVGLASLMFFTGLFAIATAFLSPWLRVRNIINVLEAKGIPYDTASRPAPETGYYVTPDYWNWPDTNWILVLLGLVVVMGGFLILKARKLNMDLEGTV